MERHQEDKMFMAAIAFSIVIGGLISFVGIGSLFILMWRAGIVNFVVWNSIFIGIFYATKIVYRILLKNVTLKDS